MTNILVTGGTGFVGKHFIKKLLQNPDFNIYVISRKNSLTHGKIHFVLPNVEEIKIGRAHV